MEKKKKILMGLLYWKQLKKGWLNLMTSQQVKLESKQGEKLKREQNIQELWDFLQKMEPTCKENTR